MPGERCHSVYAPRSAPSAGATAVRSRVGSFWRLSASATGPSVRSSAIRQAIDVSFASAGRTTQRFGIARRLIRCSTGWCVGPSSPTRDRVVRPDPDDGQPHQRREPHRGAHVVGEDEEGRAVGLQHRRIERDAVHDRAHRVLADAERDVAAGVRRREHARPLELGLRRLDEVGGAADHRRRERPERLHHRLAGVARRDLLAGREHGQRVEPARRAARPRGRARARRATSGCAAAQAASRASHAAWAAAPRSATPAMCARTSSETANVASGSKPSTSLVARTSASPSGAPCAFDVPRALGRRVARSRCAATISEGRDASSRAGGERGAQRVEVVRVVDVLDVPAVGLEAGALVLAVEAERGRAVDRDPVVVVDVDETAEAELARRSTRPPARRPPSGRRRSRSRRSTSRRSGAAAGRSGRRGTAAAIAIPTPFANPWPSGPVVVSIPAVWPCSGWPGVREPHWRNCSRSSSVTS